MKAPAWLALGALACAAPALAQTAPPGPAQPGQIEERFQPRPAPRSTPGVTVPAAPAQRVPGGAEAARFRLQDVAIAGVTVYGPQALRPLYADLIGTEVSLAQMIDLANRLTAKYRADGYILSQVVVPEQTIEDGVVQLRAVEGYIDRVSIEGDVQGRRDLLDAFARRIREARPLTAETLERNVLQVGDLPGVNVQAVLEPSPDVVGAADLRLVLQHRTFEGFVALDNRGSRFAGPWTLVAGGSAYSLFGGYEAIDILAATTPGSDEFHYGQVQVTLPVGASLAGDTVELFAGGGRIRPDIPVEIFPFETRATSFEARIGYAHPFLRSRSENLTGRVAAIWRENPTRNLDLPDSSFNPTDDDVRMVQLRGTYDVTDRWAGVNLIDVSLYQGLGILGASKGSDRVSRRTGADGTFTYLEATLSRLQQVAGNFSVYVELNGQYSFDPLLPSERFGVGGARIGRGYPPGNITGDRGIAAKIEPRYGDYVGLEWLDSYQLYAYVDAGRTWDTGAGPDEKGKLASVGAGVRLNVTEKISINPEVAHQLSGYPADRSARRHETRFLVNFVARF